MGAQAWCNLFVSWCYSAAGISSYAPKNPFYISQWRNCDAGVYSWKDYKDGKVSPKPGDILIYGSSTTNNISGSALGDSYYHISIIANYAGGVFYSIDGNYSEKVTYRSFTPNASTGYVGDNAYIHAIIQPSYNTGPDYFNQSGVVQYPTYGTVKVTKEGCTAYTLPCNSTTAQNYGCTSTPLTNKPLKAGDTVVVTGIVYNTENHYWYKVDLDKNGSEAYLYVDNTNVSSFTYASPWVYGSTFPSTITGATSLSGSILTGGSKLVSIRGMVLNGNTTDTSQLSNVYNASPISCSGTKYSLPGSSVDNGLAFENLASGRSYTLVYQVAVKHYKLISTSTISQEQTHTYTVKDRCFSVGQETQYYGLHMNGYLDGYSLGGSLGDVATVDVYIDGQLDRPTTNDYWESLPEGTNFEICNIQPGRDYNYFGAESIRGVIQGGDVNIDLEFYTKPVEVELSHHVLNIDLQESGVASFAIDVRGQSGCEAYFMMWSTDWDVAWCDTDYDTMTTTVSAQQVGHSTITFGVCRADNDEVLASDSVEIYVTDSLPQTLDGQCGDSAWWYLDRSSGLLQIFGSGDMYDYTNDYRPEFAQYQQYISEVLVTGDITRVGNHAFKNFENLLTFRNNSSQLLSIGDHAFMNCESLYSADLQGVSVIERYAFTGCGDLWDVNFGTDLTSIGFYSFGYTGLSGTVVLPVSLTSIGGKVFVRTDVEYLFVPSTVTTLPGSVADSKQMKGFVLYNTGEPASAMYYEIEEGAFRSNSTLEFVQLCPADDTIVQIQPGAFQDCQALNLVSVENWGSSGISVDSYVEIQTNAFSNCPILRHFWFQGVGADSFEEDSFPGIVATVHYPFWDSSWSRVKDQDYGGDLTWESYTETYELFFDPNGGDCDTYSKIVERGDVYGELPTPTREGYSFLGWFTDPWEGSQITEWETVRITGDMYVFAHWELNTYIITYDANGGTGEPEAQYKIHGEALTLSTTRPGRANTEVGSYTVTLNANGGSVSTTSLTAARTTSYSFQNWNTAANGSGTSYAPGASYTANAAATLYAQWNSGTTTAAVTLPTPTRTGYAFKGWATSASATSGTTGSYTPTGNVTLYAIWEANKYTVSYDANGGTGAPAAQTKTHDVAVTQSAT